jgi:hypothetical protein
VRKIPRSGGAATTIGSGGIQSSGIVVDNACVYWNGGSIYKAPK